MAKMTERFQEVSESATTKENSLSESENRDMKASKIVEGKHKQAQTPNNVQN
jgi:hypothetical protein